MLPRQPPLEGSLGQGRPVPEPNEDALTSSLRPARIPWGSATKEHVSLIEGICWSVSPVSRDWRKARLQV